MKRSEPEELAGLSVEELISLNERIAKMVADRIETEKKALKYKLEAIHRFEERALARRRSEEVDAGSADMRRRTKASPKYRNPETGETWAGRGMQPRWMRQAIEAGHGQEDFRIQSDPQPGRH
jgi:DNA-binding protein H-NS